MGHICFLDGVVGDGGLAEHDRAAGLRGIAEPLASRAGKPVVKRIDQAQAQLYGSGTYLTASDARRARA
jgi:hypothetical protein